MYEALIRPLLFALSNDDPEKAHILAKRFLAGLQNSALLSLVELLYRSRINPRPASVAGITFPNRVGMAAGFDKNAEVLLALQALGFGFIEVGSILPRYQKGNNRPRMFRFPEREAILNRMGFNSEGVEIALKNIAAARAKLRIPIIGSLGKMKETPLDDAAEDYKAVLRQLRGSVSACTINVSSPNTPGLRALQGKEHLENLVHECYELDQRLAWEEGDKLQLPIFVKIAPDLTELEIEETMGAAIAGKASGIIATNTTSDPQVKAWLETREEGGVSGVPLRMKAIATIKLVKKYAPNLPLIAVGGIDSRNEAELRFDLGADLVQIFTGLVYHGPKLISDIRSLG